MSLRLRRVPFEDPKIRLWEGTLEGKPLRLIEYPDQLAYVEYGPNAPCPENFGTALSPGDDFNWSGDEDDPHYEVHILGKLKPGKKKAVLSHELGHIRRFLKGYGPGQTSASAAREELAASYVALGKARTTPQIKFARQHIRFRRGVLVKEVGKEEAKLIESQIKREVGYSK